VPVYTNKKNGRLFVQFDYLGQTYKRTLPESSTKADAKKLETKLRADLFFQANGIAQKRGVLFEEFVVDTYLPSVLESQGQAAHDRAEQILISAIPFMRGKEMRAIKADDIERFQRYRTNLKFTRGKDKTPRDRAPSTVHREMAIVGKMFSDAVRNDLIDYNPCSRVSKPKVENFQDRVLHHGDDDKFFAAFGDQNATARDICKLVLHTGLSQKDVLRLTRFNVNLRDRMITFTRSKTTRRVEMPLNDVAFEVVAARMTNLNSLLFVSRKTGKQIVSVKTAMAGACRRAKIPKLSIRDLRRTFGTRLYESGADILTIAQLLGHAGLRMIPRYVRSVKNQRSAVEMLTNPRDFSTSAAETKP
jgi:integrase